MLRDFLLRPARTARLHGHVYGAGYWLATIRARHTCSHRVDELLAIDEEVGGGSATLVRGGSQ